MNLGNAGSEGYGEEDERLSGRKQLPKDQEAALLWLGNPSAEILVPVTPIHDQPLATSSSS
jgi:hypothetical protein